MNQHNDQTTIPLDGIDGANPLGFLAAVGTLVTLSRAPDAEHAALGWEARGGAWRPVIKVRDISEPGILIDRLTRALPQTEQSPAFSIGDDLNIPCETFRNSALEAAATAAPNDRRFGDFMAAFASDVIEATVNGKPNGAIADTAFRTMSGAGHQHFLGAMRTFVRDTTAEHLEKALFQPWTYDDPAEKHSMRWDPFDDVRYALRWRNPSGDPERRAGGSVWGANRLAIEALPLFPTAPQHGGLSTTGFTDRPRQGTFWTWPIWRPSVSADLVRSLVALRELQRSEPQRARLVPRGIVEVYRSQRITQGKYRNFTHGTPV